MGNQDYKKSRRFHEAHNWERACLLFLLVAQLSFAKEILQVIELTILINQVFEFYYC